VVGRRSVDMVIRPYGVVMSKEVTLHRVPFVHIYRDLSFSDFFRRYDPWRDGKVVAATYSFSHKDFDFWARLLPNSIIYVDQKYEATALAFLKRFPWFEVRSVKRLHSKAVFFEKSGVLLVGSENLYAPESLFSEVMVETYVAESDRSRVKELLFGDLHGTLLSCKYGIKDLRLHDKGALAEGTPFVPCNIEVDHWDLIGNVVTPGPNGLTPPNPEFSSPQRLYVVLEYELNGRDHYAALNRGYGYCGDLDQEAFAWLSENCSIEQIQENYDGGLFPAYHPVPKDRCARRAIWFGAVVNPAQHPEMKVVVRRVDITGRKIRRIDSLATD
jgi:hypothetical protein